MQTQTFDKLYKSLLTEPENWSQTEYTLDHNRNGIRIWTGNVPLFHLSLYMPFHASFTLFQKIKLYKVIKQMNDTVIEDLLKE